MPGLAKLPNLRFLEIAEDAYVGSSYNGLLCQWISKARDPSTHSLGVIKEVDSRERCYASLTILRINKIFCLEMIPKGLEFVAILKKKKNWILKAWASHSARRFESKLEMKMRITTKCDTYSLSVL